MPDPGKRLPVGAAGPLHISTHCGLRYAGIDGRTWETEELGNGRPLGAADADDFVVGVATRPATNLVTFQFESAGTLRTVVFRPATVDPTYVCF